DRHHRLEHAGLCSRVIRFELLRGSNQGDMSLSCSTGIVGIEVRSIQTGIDDLGDMVTNGERNLTEGNEATQALIGLEQHEKAKLRKTAFAGSQAKKPACRSRPRWDMIRQGVKLFYQMAHLD